MKRIIIVTLFFLMTISTMAQKATISGKINGFVPGSNPIIMEYLNTQKQYPVILDADGKFTVDIPMDLPKLFYMVSVDPKGGYVFYLEPGAEVNWTIHFQTTEANQITPKMVVTEWEGPLKDCFEHVNEHNYYKVQNSVVDKWSKQPNLNFRDFRADLRAEIDREEAALAQVGTLSFRRCMRDAYEKLLMSGLQTYMELDGPYDKDFEAYVNSFDYSDPQVESLHNLKGDCFMKYQTPTDTDPLLHVLTHIDQLYTSKEVAQNFITKRFAEAITKAPQNLDELYKAYKDYMASNGIDIPEDVQSSYNYYKNMVAGKKGVDFELFDINGKKLSFSDLKGKAVYIDCWATWCGPCKKEIPHIRQLYEHFKKDKRLQIISISIDSNLENWKKMVNAEAFPWSQYVVKGNWNSEFCKTYGVNAIPRFMMFDKKGNIISLHAPLPSEENIIEWIESNLSE